MCQVHIVNQSPKPITWPDSISVYHKLRVPSSANADSFKLDAIILSERHQRVAARSTEDIVLYHYPSAKKIGLLPFMITAFQETSELQEKSRIQNSNKIEGLLQRVRTLELSSWDREDAKEHFGV